MAPSLFRGIGRIADAVGRFVPVPDGVSYEAAWLLTSATPTDDSHTLADLEMQWRSPTDAIVKSFRASSPSPNV